MVAMDFFEASNFYDFFNQYCLNLLKNPTVRGLMIFMLKEFVVLSKVVVIFISPIIEPICDRIWEKVHCRAHNDFSE